MVVPLVNARGLAQDRVVVGSRSRLIRPTVQCPHLQDGGAPPAVSGQGGTAAFNLVGSPSQPEIQKGLVNLS
jgi:hypothetical protein